MGEEGGWKREGTKGGGRERCVCEGERDGERGSARGRAGGRESESERERERD